MHATLWAGKIRGETIAMSLNRSSFRTSIVESAYRYWASRSTPGRLPSRADLKPEEIPFLLPHMFLVDVQGAPLGFRFRLVGTEITRLASREYTGVSLNEQAYGPGWHAVFADYAQVVRTKTPRLTIRSAPWAGREFLVYERLIAPLSTTGEAVDMLFGALHPVAEGSPARGKRRGERP
jgi:hypothetical protein